MALSITTTQVGANAQYEPYLFGSPVKTDRYKDAVLLDFSLAPIDESFEKLTVGAYVTFETTTYGKWFTGYIINDPSYEYLGSKAGVAKWGYKYKATSDEFILSLKPIGLVPPFLNVTAGEIIKTLVDRLAPGVGFDVTGIKDGPLYAQYTIDTEKKFADVVRELCEGSSFNFYALDKQLYFAPVDSEAEVVLDGTVDTFTPSSLEIAPATNALINDALVVGDIEPQKYVTEYFVGTGLDALFPLIESVFGADKTVYIDEDFDGGTISASWEVFDSATPKLKVDSGYLNILGGTAGGTTYLRSKTPVPLDGFMRLTHGEWDFISGTGYIGGLWKTAPGTGGVGSGCLYGLFFDGTSLSPVVNGAEDTGQSVTIDTDKRYVIRTIADIREFSRNAQPYSYTNSDGVVVNVNQSGTAHTAVMTTLINEIDPSNGKIENQFTFTNNVTLSDTDLYASYIPIASINMQGTVTGITVSIPMNASLEMADRLSLKNNGFDNWTDGELDHWTDSQNISEDAGSTGSGLKLTKTSGNDAYTKFVIDKIIKPDTQYNLAVRLKKDSGVSGSVNIFFEYDLLGVTYDISGFSVESSTGITSTSNYDVHYGVLTTGLTTVYEGMRLVVAYVGGADGHAVYVDDLNIQTPWVVQLVGPNELDASDGLAPAATIISAQSTAENRNSVTGLPQFTSGQSQLAFFKDSVNRTSAIPLKDQILRVSYRSGGPALGRAIDYTSKLAEAIRWGDDGTRNVTRADLIPRPRTSLECEAAAAALVAQNSRVHYQGSYTQYSLYFTEEPKSGFLIKFENIPDLADGTEVITEVTSTMVHGSPEHFTHRLSFGPVDNIRTLLNKFAEDNSPFQKPTVPNVKVNPSSVDVVGRQYAPPILKPYVKGWDNSQVYVNIGQPLTSDALFFELRNTDDSWGVDDGRNLIARITSGTDINVDRNLRGKTIYMRQVNEGNRLLWSEDQTNAVYATSGGTTTLELTRDEDYSSILAGKTVLSGAGSIQYSSYTPSGGSNYCFSVSLKALDSSNVGKTVTISFSGQTKAVVLTGGWQRVSVPVSGSGSSGAISIAASIATSFYSTRWSVEAGTLYEKMYSRTTANPYGPTSRYSTVLNVSFPVQDADLIDEIIDSLPPGSDPPDDVTIVSGTWVFGPEAADYGKEAVLTVTYNAPSPVGSFTGVQAYWYGTDGKENSGGAFLYGGSDPGEVVIKIAAPVPAQDIVVKLTSKANEYENSTGPTTTILGVGGTLDAENVAGITVSVNYDADKWGMTGVVSFGSNRASIDYCELIIVGPYDMSGNVMPGITIERPWTTFIPPVSGTYSFTVEPSWLRYGNDQKFKVVCKSYNYLNIATASPVESTKFTVSAVNLTTQATSIGATVEYFYTADGIGVWRLYVQWTNANDIDFEKTQIFLEESLAIGGYTAPQLYIETGPNGVGAGFAQTGRGSMIDVIPTASRFFVVSFKTVTKDGQLRAGHPTTFVIVSPQTGRLDFSRYDPTKVSAEFTSSFGQFSVASLSGAKLVAGTVSTVKLDATQIDVGGGGSKPGRFRVFDPFGNINGYIGSDPYGWGLNGAWFKELRVGGSNPLFPKLTANSSGDLTITGGTFELNLNGITTSIYNQFGVGGYAGLKVKDNSSNKAVYITNVGMAITAFSGTTVFQANESSGRGLVFVYDSAGFARVQLDGSGTGIGYGPFTAAFFDSSYQVRLAIDSSGYLDIKQPAAPSATMFIEWVWIKVNGNLRKIPAYL